MKAPEYYRGKEQTWLKHFFLEQYLETVAAHIGYTQTEFAYVDLFSGPWRAEDKELADTSIRIALDKLNYVRDKVLAPHRRYPTIRAIFVERDPTAFAALSEALERYRGGIQTKAIPGAFEDNVLAVLKEIGRRFSFLFIDPTGWNLPMDRVEPILRHQPGEVVINFMYDFINRFLNSRDPATEASLDRYFGTGAWRTLRESSEREADAVRLYARQVRNTGRFNYVTSTRILKPLYDRAYFHLVYATRSPKGIEKFREVEKRLVTVQESVRDTAKRDHRIERTGQEELSFGVPAEHSTSLELERAKQRERARAGLMRFLAKGPSTYETLLPKLLQIPLFWKTDFHALIAEERRAGRIAIDGLATRQRVPNRGCIIRLARDG
jgi:three-Cys-motif partner protein